MHHPTRIVSFNISSGMVWLWSVRVASMLHPWWGLPPSALQKSSRFYVPPPLQRHLHTCAGAAVRAGRGETRPLWQGRRGPCPGHWACAGHRALTGQFSDRPAGTGSPYRSWRPWTASQWGPWVGWGEILHSLNTRKWKTNYSYKVKRRAEGNNR